MKQNWKFETGKNHNNIITVIFVWVQSRLCMEWKWFLCDQNSDFWKLLLWQNAHWPNCIIEWFCGWFDVGKKAHIIFRKNFYASAIRIIIGKRPVIYARSALWPCTYTMSQALTLSPLLHYIQCIALKHHRPQNQMLKPNTYEKAMKKNNTEILFKYYVLRVW